MSDFARISICFVSHKKSNDIGYIRAKERDLKLNKKFKYNQINYSQLDNKRGWILGNKKMVTNINKIENCGKKLGELYKIKNGLATLANNIYIFRPISQDHNYYVRRINGKEFLIEKKICKDIIKPNILKSDQDVKELKEKIIFPYFNNGTKIDLIKEEYFKKEAPKTYDYLCNFKEVLSKRDKGKKDYDNWYAFGRTQALTDKGIKLVFPYIAKKPLFLFSEQKNLLVYCGYSIFSNHKKDLLVLKKILESDLFWYYIRNTSKPYSGDFYSLAKNYVINFGICDLDSSEKNFLLRSQKNVINDFLFNKYDIEI